MLLRKAIASYMRATTRTNVICGWWRCTGPLVNRINRHLRSRCRIKIPPFQRSKAVRRNRSTFSTITDNILFCTDADRARKHGMEDFISADPCQFDHASLFKTLQNLTLEYRLNDPYCSLVIFFNMKNEIFFIFFKFCFRDGLVPAKCSSSTNTVPVTVYEAVTDTYVTYQTY